MSKKHNAPVAENPSGDWEAEEDARSLARHHEIHADPKRHAKAITAAQKMEADAALKAKSMHKVAMGKPKMVDDGQVRQMPFKK